MRAIYGQDDAVATWAGERLGKPFALPYVAIGFASDRGLVGAAIFNGWNGSNMDLTVVGCFAWTRGVIRTALAYAFVQCGANRLTVRTRRENKRAISIATRFGFKFECVARRWYGPAKQDDGVVFALYPDQAGRWLA